MVRCTPARPQAIGPWRYARSTGVNFAFGATGATMSAPFMMPVSMVTSRSSPTSRTTLGQQVKWHRRAALAE